MDLGTIRQRNKRRNNRNFYIITIGFICSLIVVIFGAQSMLMKMGQKKIHLLHCEIENNTSATILGKMNIGDVILFEDTLPQGKTNFEYKWHFDTTKTITSNFNSQSTEIQGISVPDSVSYLMIILSPKDTSFKVDYSFCRGK